MEKRQEHWGGLAAGFFFLSSMGAMMFVIIGMLDFANSLLAQIVGGWLALAACVIIGIGGVMLFAELGNKGKAYMLHKPCIMLLGAACMAVCAGCALVYASFFIELPWSDLAWLRRVVAVVGMLAGLVLVLYPGPEMGEACGRPFWRAGGLMLLFLVTASTIGLAAILLFGSICATDTLFGDATLFVALLEYLSLDFLRTLFTGALVVEAIAIFIYLLAVKGSHPAATYAVNNIMKGDYKIAFWGGVIVIGIAIPLVLMLLPAIPGLVMLACFCAIIGGAFLRAIILFAGVRVVLPGEENEFIEQDEISELAVYFNKRWDEKAKWLSGRP